MTDEKDVGLKGWLSGPRPKEVRTESKSSTLLDKYRIAVLPLSNISPDPQDEYFAEGITDELIATISKIQGLHVLARTSSMKYKGSGKGVSEIGRELRIGSIVEGTVRKAGSRIRVTAQLVDSQTEESLWSETYDRELGDIFNIQSDIARNVAEGLKLRFHTVGGERIERRPTRNTEAYALYLKGRYFWNRDSMEWFKRALDQFELAIRKDPDFALAYSGLADTYVVMGRTGNTSPRFAYPKAVEYANKAISLDPELPEPHVALAAIRQEYEWKWEESERRFKRAIELNPNYAIAHGWYALFLGHVGRIDEGIKEATLAQEFDPLSPRVHCVASEEYLFAHQYDKSIDAAEKALEIGPGYGGAYGYRAYALIEKKMYDKAIESLREAGEQGGARAWMGRLGHAYGVSGQTNNAVKILHELENEPLQPPPKSPFLPPPPDTAFDIGLVQLGLGNFKESMSSLEKAAEEHTAEIIHIKSEPIYAPLRQDARFQALMRKIGLTL